MKNPFAKAKVQDDPTIYVEINGERYDLAEMRYHAQGIVDEEDVTSFEASVNRGLALAVVALIDKYRAEAQDRVSA